MSKINQIIYSKCRLCYNRNGINNFLNDVEFIKKVYLCTSIKLDDEITSGLPKTVCSDCKIVVETFFQYVEQVKRTDEFLKNCINKDCNSELEYDQAAKKHHCEDCPKSFVRLSNLQAHVLIHNKLYCKICKTLFESDLIIEGHECTSKNGKQNLVESQALQKLQENVNMPNKYLDDAWKNEEEIKSYTCKLPNCKKTYSRAYALRTHEMKHEGKNRFLCVTCGKCFSNISSQSLNCGISGKGFLTKNSLTYHEKTHLPVKGFTCKLCNIGFSVRSNLRSHERKHHEGVRFYCSKCTKVFISKCSLERHEKIHTGIKEFKCDNCPSAFYTKKELLKHQRYHQDLRKYKCDTCFKMFFEKHHLVVHTRIHTGERPYVCKFPECSKSFMESPKLARHIRTRHKSIVTT